MDDVTVDQAAQMIRRLIPKPNLSPLLGGGPSDDAWQTARRALEDMAPLPVPGLLPAANEARREVGYYRPQFDRTKSALAAFRAHAIMAVATGSVATAELAAEAYNLAVGGGPREMRGLIHTARVAAGLEDPLYDAEARCPREAPCANAVTDGVSTMYFDARTGSWSSVEDGRIVGPLWAAEVVARLTGDPRHEAWSSVYAERRRAEACALVERVECAERDRQATRDQWNEQTAG